MTSPILTRKEADMRTVSIRKIADEMNYELRSWTGGVAATTVMGWMERLQALADGRTACVERRTEEEHLAVFNPWYEAQWWTRDIGRQACWGVWMACARAMGAVR